MDGTAADILYCPIGSIMTEIPPLTKSPSGERRDGDGNMNRD